MACNLKNDVDNIFHEVGHQNDVKCIIIDKIERDAKCSNNFNGWVAHLPGAARPSSIPGEY